MKTQETWAVRRCEVCARVTIVETASAQRVCACGSTALQEFDRRR
ncbi:hypothetical protein [Natrinema versiforme]|nr:hypothetical protein [Natrinema versiforme]